METKKDTTKKITVGQIMYPAIVAMIVVATAGVLILSARSLTREINHSLLVGVAQQETDLLINMEGFAAVAKKIGITIAEEEPQVPAQNESAQKAKEEAAPAPVAETPVALPETPQVPPPAAQEAPPPVVVPAPERSAVRISVLNSTKTAGLAGKMKNALIGAGFTAVITGNQSPVLATTVVRAKSSLGALGDEIRNIVGAQQYQFNAEEIDPANENDVIIIIGNR
jgi:hypothetical protein